MENVIYNWGRTAGEVFDDAGFSAHLNVIGNQYLRGPSSLSAEFVINKGETAASAYPKIYARDNLGPRRMSSATDEFALFSLGWGNTRLPDDLRVAEPFESRVVGRLQGEDLVKAVLARAGATLPHRDAVDQRVVDTVKQKQGRMINSPSDVGGYPKMASGEPPIDSDHDGMPDEWENKMGLNPRDPADAAHDRHSDGYTNIEKYLHWLTARR